MSETEEYVSNSYVILPWRSEFGTMMMHYVRFVHGFRHVANNLVVCCRKGDEALFPTATSFFYDWEQVPDAQKNTALLKSSSNANYLDQLQERLQEKFNGYTIVAPPLKTRIDREWDFTPAPKIKRGLHADIVIAPRYRKHGEHRNFQHWATVAEALLGQGYDVAAIGMKETSVDIPGLTEYSWDYDSLDASLELIQNCRLVVTTESGMGHLAVLAGAPLKIIYDRKGREAGHPTWRWNLPHMQAYSKNHCEPILLGWNDPAKVVNDINAYLKAHRDPA